MSKALGKGTRQSQPPESSSHSRTLWPSGRLSHPNLTPKSCLVRTGLISDGNLERRVPISAPFPPAGKAGSSFPRQRVCVSLDAVSFSLGECGNRGNVQSCLVRLLEVCVWCGFPSTEGPQVQDTLVSFELSRRPKMTEGWEKTNQNFAHFCNRRTHEPIEADVGTTPAQNLGGGRPLASAQAFQFDSCLFWHSLTFQIQTHPQHMCYLQNTPAMHLPAANKTRKTTKLLGVSAATQRAQQHMFAQ